MPSFTLACVGRLREAYLSAACDEYLRRLNPAWPVEVIEARRARLPENPSPAQVEKALGTEGGELLARIPDSAYVTALCVEGRQMDSPAFSNLICERMTHGVSSFVFVIGGPYGLSETVKRRAALRLSFSPMTFPHQLMRVMLLEQLYRAYAIAGGSPYHK